MIIKVYNKFIELTSNYSEFTSSLRSFWEGVPVGVWSARDHFVMLMMRATTLASGVALENSFLGVRKPLVGLGAKSDYSEHCRAR